MSEPLTAAQLRARRKRLGLSQMALAARLGVRNDTLSRWERGRLPIHYPGLLDLALRALEYEHAAGQ